MSNDTTAPAWATAYTRLALAALPADLTTATPPVIDEAIRTLQLDLQVTESRLGGAFDALHTVLGEEKVSSGVIERTNYRGEHTYVQVWPTSAAAALDAARALPADTASAGYSYRGPETVGEALATIEAYQANISEIVHRLADLHDEFDRRGGWTRYYRVNNSGGHVHTTTACRTTYVTTPWSWPTNLSGADGAQVVEYAGALTCLVCFPDEREDILAERPVRLEMFETPEQRDERVKREDEAKAKRDAKIAKGITPDGSPLVVWEPGWRGEEKRRVELKTARAAELRYVEFMFEARSQHNSDSARAVYAESALEIAAALATKQGTTRNLVQEAMQAKVDKRIKRGY